MSISVNLSMISSLSVVGCLLTGCTTAFTVGSILIEYVPGSVPVTSARSGKSNSGGSCVVSIPQILRMSPSCMARFPDILLPQIYQFKVSCHFVAVVFDCDHDCALRPDFVVTA